MKSASTRLTELDWARLACAIGVFLIHTSGHEPSARGAQTLEDWVVLWIGQVGRFAVPLFYFVSAFLWARSDRKITTQATKIVVPVLFASVLFELFQLNPKETQAHFASEDPLQRILTLQSIYLYYFVREILILWLASAIFLRMQYFKNPRFWIFLGCTTYTVVLTSFYGSLIRSGGYFDLWRISSLPALVPYALGLALGLQLSSSRSPTSSSRSLIVWIALFFLSSFLSLLETVWISKMTADFFMPGSEVKLSCALLSICAWKIFQHLKNPVPAFLGLSFFGAMIWQEPFLFHFRNFLALQFSEWSVLVRVTVESVLLIVGFACLTQLSNRSPNFLRKALRNLLGFR